MSSDLQEIALWHFWLLNQRHCWQDQEEIEPSYLKYLSDNSSIPLGRKISFILVCKPGHTSAGLNQTRLAESREVGFLYHKTEEAFVFFSPPTHQTALTSRCFSFNSPYWTILKRYIFTNIRQTVSLWCYYTSELDVVLFQFHTCEE